MKPITDDVVQSFLRGVEEREKTARRSPPKKSAKILKFSAAPTKSGVVAPQGQKSRRTISGVFCYVSRLRSI